MPHIRHDGRGLPAPFHRGMTIGTADRGAGHAPRALHALTHRTAEVADRLREESDALAAVSEDARMRLLSVVPEAVEVDDAGAIALDALARMEGLDGNGVRTVFEEIVGPSAVGRAGWERLSTEADAQRERRRAAGLVVLADTVTARCLSRMPDGVRRRLMDVLRDEPRPTGIGWTKAALLSRGVRVDDAVKTLRLDAGKLSGRIALSRRTTWNRGRLTILGETPPDSVIQAMAGRPVTDVVSHPLLDEGMVVASAAALGRSSLRLNVGHPDVDMG